MIENCRITIYFIPSSEFNAYLKQIKVILSAVKKYRIFSLVTNIIYMFSLQQTEAVLTILGSISFPKKFGMQCSCPTLCYGRTQVKYSNRRHILMSF